MIQFTATPSYAEQGGQAGPVLSNGQRSNGQSMRLDAGIPLEGGGTAAVQVEVRIGNQNFPLNLSDDKQYTVTVEEVA